MIIIEYKFALPDLIVMKYIINQLWNYYQSIILLSTKQAIIQIKILILLK